jgi:hypothetical protein
MTYPSPAQKAPRSTAHAKEELASAGSQGIAISPPAYGIDLVDRERVDRLTISPAQHFLLQRQVASSPAVRGGGVVERHRSKAIERDWREASDPQAVTSPSAPVSVELDDAPAATTAMERVQLWLVQHRQEIITAEARHAIDRRAIAGAIAWEALENVRDWYWQGFARFQGPGKVHYKEFHTEEGAPVAKEVEQRGYLPQRSMEQRRDIVASPAGATEYIAAIMEAYADEAALASYNIYYDPAILATFYNGVKVAPNLKAAREYFQTKRYPQKLQPNQMGQWIISHLAKIEAAVGKPSGAGSGQPGMGDLKLREAVLEERRQRMAPLEQETTKTQDTSSKQVATKQEDVGQKRADAARGMVEKLSKAGATYRQQPGGRDWQDYTLSDCSKFVQWTLEEAGQGSLFGRERATTALMQQVIQEMSKDGGGLRSDNPRIGDIMMWGGHVGIVTDVGIENKIPCLEFAAMGGKGASLTGTYTDKKGQRKFWLKVSDVPSNAKLGSGGFLGYWTPQ